MIVRRAFYYAQSVAAFALPAWLLVGWGLFGGGGLTLILALLGSIALTIAMLIVAGITIARRSVRVDRAVSWIDVGILAAWYALIIAGGFYPAWGGILIAGVIAAGLAGFWAAIGQFVTDTGRRARTMFATFGATPPPGPTFGPRMSAPSVPPSPPSPYADGEYIVIETSRDRERRDTD